MRSRASSAESTASTSSSIASPAQLRTMAARGRVSSRDGRHQYSQAQASHSKTLGSVMKLVQLAFFGLVLALVVPFVRSHLFSATSSAVKNQPLAKSPHAAHVAAAAAAKQHHTNSQPDLFEFRHEDYLIKSNAAAHKATPEDEAMVPIGTVRDRPATSKLATASAVPKRNKQQRAQRQRDEDDEETGWSIGTIGSVALRILTFLAIPFRLLYGVVRSLTTRSYTSFRWSLSHTMRPVSVGLAPLFYLYSGLVYIFVQVPGRFLLAAARELFPLYLFLGAASVIGITMGLAAAAVLYITSFLFADRSGQRYALNTEPIDRKGKGMRRRSSPRRRRRSSGSNKKRLTRNIKQEDDEELQTTFQRAWGHDSPKEPTPSREHHDDVSPPLNAPNSYFQFPVDARRGSTESPLPSPASYPLSFPLGATGRHSWNTLSPSIARSNQEVDPMQDSSNSVRKRRS